MDYGSINFYRGLCLENEELRNWDESLRAAMSHLLFNKCDLDVGVLTVRSGYGSLKESYFEVSSGALGGSGYLTVTFDAGVGVFDISIPSLPSTVSAVTFDVYSGVWSGAVTNFLKRKIIETAMFQNVEIPGVGSLGSGDVRYASLIPCYDPMEPGICTITAASNQVTIANGSFDYLLRGMDTGSPTKIRFFQSDGTAAANDEIYEVVEVVSSTEIVITGNLTNESTLKYVVVGTFDLIEQQDLDTKNLYHRITAIPAFYSTVNDAKTAGGFPVARLDFTGTGVYTITDIRDEYLWEWNNDTYAYTWTQLGTTNIYYTKDRFGYVKFRGTETVNNIVAETMPSGYRPNGGTENHYQAVYYNITLGGIYFAGAGTIAILTSAGSSVTPAGQYVTMSHVTFYAGF